MAKEPEEMRVQLVNDWYGPDGKFRRVTDNPHLISARLEDKLPPSALIEVDGTFVKQSLEAKEAIKDAEPEKVVDEKPASKTKL